MNRIVTKIKYIFLILFFKKSIKTGPKTMDMTTKLKSFYDLKMKANNGKEMDFSSYKGKKVMLVNVASKCGYTPQYKELEELYKKYKNTLVILGFPADNFAGQEPLDNEEIAAFCEINFGVTFQLFEKSSVKGREQNPVYYWLTHKEENGWNDTPPSWNFCKYLVNEKGELIKFYSASISPLSEEITKEL